MTADTTTKISDFLRDAQVRVGQLTASMAASGNEGSTMYQEQYTQRKALYDFITILYDKYAAPMSDGLTTFLIAPPLADMDSTKYPAWTDREIVDEIEYLRWYGQLTYNPASVFIAYYTQIIEVQAIELISGGNWDPTTNTPLLLDSAIPADGFFYTVINCDDGFRFQSALLFNNSPIVFFTNDTILSNGVFWKVLRGDRFTSIVDWVAGNYTHTNEYVWSSHNGPRQLFRLVNGARPYTSSNIANEEATGDWLSITDVTYPLSQNTAASGVIVLDLKRLRKPLLYGSVSIGENKTLSLLNTINNSELYFKFTLTNTWVLTMPSSFKMSDVQWDSVAKTWSPIQAGEYEMFGTFTNGEWLVRIVGPYA